MLISPSKFSDNPLICSKSSVGFGYTKIDVFEISRTPTVEIKWAVKITEFVFNVSIVKFLLKTHFLQTKINQNER